MRTEIEYSSKDYILIGFIGTIFSPLLIIALFFAVFYLLGILFVKTKYVTITKG